MRIRLIPGRRLRRYIRRAQQAARDGMRLSVLALVAVVVFSHPGHQELLVIAVGLAGIFCARLSSSSGRSPARSFRPAAAGTGPGRAAPRPSKSYSPECLAMECGSCSGIGCDHDCGHPGRSRTRSRWNGTRPSQSVPDDSEPPF